MFILSLHTPQGYNLQYIYPALNRHLGTISFYPSGACVMSSSLTFTRAGHEGNGWIPRMPCTGKG